MGQVHLTSLFGKLSLDNILLLFRCILFEKRILLVSSDYQRVIDVAELLTEVGTRVFARTRAWSTPHRLTPARVCARGVQCLFPFCWPYVYVPCLPVSLLHFLDAPVPFIIGTSEHALTLTDLPDDVRR